uniref:Leucine rich repeat containing protein n=1 Tax=Solanum tuberosum TaxID=4113 RepID=M1CEQ1_SOLTU
MRLISRIGAPIPTTTFLRAAFLGNETDKLALLGFKSQITEDPARVFASWNDSVHFCQWTGVKCGLRHGRVIRLNLKGRGWQNILLDEDLTAHLDDFGLVRLILDEDLTAQFSSLGVMGTIGYAAPEYGMVNKVSALGDMYSFGILILEIFTGRRPTDTLFQASSSPHHFVETALPEKVMEILDKTTFHGEMSKATNVKEHWGSIKKEEMECLVSILEIGVACSAESPRDRLTVTQVYNTDEVFLSQSWSIMINTWRVSENTVDLCVAFLALLVVCPCPLFEYQCHAHMTLFSLHLVKSTPSCLALKSLVLTYHFGIKPWCYCAHLSFVNRPSPT